jgi:hypothetical protein
MHSSVSPIHHAPRASHAGTSATRRWMLALAAEFGAAAALMLAAPMSPAAAQTLHLNDRWDNCAIVIAPSLTQEAWREFVGEVGLVVYFRPLTDAKPLGRGRIEVAAVNWSTRVDDTKPAWNDTFSHPDSTHWLQASAGVAVHIGGVRLGAEYNLARVTGYSFKLGYGI